MADRELYSSGAAATVEKLWRAVTRNEVLSPLYILILCASFALEARGHRGLFYVLAVPPFVLNLRAIGWRRLWQSWIVRLAVFYLAYYLLSAFWSDGLSWKSLLELIRIDLLLLLFLVTTLHLALEDPPFEERLFFWFATAAGVSLLVVFAAILPSWESSGWSSFGWRFVGFGLASHPIIGATLYGFALLLSAFFLLPRAGARQERALWLAVICLCAAFVMMTGSRGPLLALAVALIVGLVIADRRVAMIAIAAVAASTLAGLLLDIPSFALLYGRDGSGHFEIWRQALAAVADSPWLGHGSLTSMHFASPYGPQRSPHNLLLANQFYGGVPATLLLGALFVLVLRQAVRARNAGRPIYLVLLVFGLAASLFDSRSLVQNLGREWITLWLPMVLLAAEEVRQGKTAPGGGGPS